MGPGSVRDHSYRLQQDEPDDDRLVGVAPDEERVAGTGHHQHRGRPSPTGSCRTWKRTCERDRPGELIHVGIKKLARIPDSVGHRTLGRQAGRATRAGMGFGYVHSAVDAHTRLAYSEIHPDGKATTCTGFLRRAAAFFAGAGIDLTERVLTDNARGRSRSP